MFYDNKEVTGLLVKYRDNHNDFEAVTKLYTIMHPVGLLVAKSYFSTKRRTFHYQDYEDAVSRGFMQIIQKISTFTKGDNGGAWILKIVQNECYQIMRERKKFVSTEMLSIPDTNDYADNVLTEVFENEFMQQLSAIDKEVYICTKNNFTAEEISQLTKKSLSTIKRKQKSNRQKFEMFINGKIKDLEC